MATDRQLLFVSHVPPGAVSGGGLYTRTVLRLLGALGMKAGIDVAAPSGDGAGPGRLACVLEGLLTGRAARAVYAARSGLDTALRRRSGTGPPDVLVLNGPDALGLAEARGLAEGVPFVLVCHNLEADTYDAQLAALPGPARLAMRLTGDAGRFRRLEARAFARAALVLAISAEDAAAIARARPGTGVLHLPPVFGTAPPERGRGPRGAGPLRLGFVGRMRWWPNRDAVEWLLREVLSPMPEGLELHLFGQGSEAWHAPERGCHGHGFVAGERAVWEGMDLMLCPMRRGGGANVKLAEALWRGVPVLATPFALRGFALPAEAPGLRVAGDAARWRDLLAQQARTLAAERPDPALGARFSVAGQAGRLAGALRCAGLAAALGLEEGGGAETGRDP